MRYAALFALIASLLSTTTFAQDAAPPGPVLPAGLDEDRVLHALVRDYADQRLASQRCEHAVESDGCQDSLFSLEITEVLEIGPPVDGQRLVAVSAEGREGVCNQCLTHYIGVFALPSQALVWSFGGVGHYGPAHMKIEPPISRNGPTFLQFESAEGSSGGMIETTRYWLYPEAPDSVLSLTAAWSGLSERYVTSRDLLYTAHATIGSLPRKNSKGRFEQVLRSFFAEADCECSTPSGDDTPCTAVEVQAVLPLRWDGRLLAPSSEPAKITRHDHCQSELFPFSLPIRSHAYVRRSEGVSIAHASLTDGRRVDSPKGRYSVLVAPGFWDPLVIARNSDGAVLRTVRLALPPGFCGAIRGIGWSTDESRAFIAVEFAPNTVALLSFSVTGARDFWEATLSTPSGYGTDGFLMAARVLRQ